MDTPAQQNETHVYNSNFSILEKKQNTEGAAKLGAVALKLLDV